MDAADRVAEEEVESLKKLMEAEDRRQAAIDAKKAAKIRWSEYWDRAAPQIQRVWDEQERADADYEILKRFRQERSGSY